MIVAKRKLVPIVARVIGAAALLSCGGTEPSTPVLSSMVVTLDPQSISVGANATAAAAGIDQSNAPIALAGLTWSTSSAAIATVSSEGVVHGVAVGTAQIRATSGSKEASATITVTPVPVAAVAVAASSATEVVGGTVQMSATLTSADGAELTGRAVTWNSSNTGIASVSPAGLVRILAPGTAQITGSAEGKSGTLAITAVPFVLTAMSAGADYTCGLTVAKSIFCWGENVGGKVGDATNVDRRTPVPIASTIRFNALFSGWNHACGIAASGDAICWGANHFGQMGNGTTTSLLNGEFTPIPAAPGLKFVAIAPGQFRACGVAIGGTAYCWGSNGGSFGDGTSNASLTPVAASGGLSFQTLVVGQGHACALTAAGTAYCWGSNVEGQLGDGTNTQRLTPTPVAGGLVFKAITAGATFTCGLTTAGAAYCWGGNLEKELGDGTQTNSPSPVAVQGGLTFASIAAGGSHVCAITAAGAAYCWGSGTSGQIGDVTTGGLRGAPAAVSGGLTFANITAGTRHTCGVTTGGASYCWGTNVKGALGDGTITRHDLPALISPPVIVP